MAGQTPPRFTASTRRNDEILFPATGDLTPETIAAVWGGYCIGQPAAVICAIAPIERKSY